VCHPRSACFGSPPWYKSLAPTQVTRLPLHDTLVPPPRAPAGPTWPPPLPAPTLVRIPTVDDEVVGIAFVTRWESVWRVDRWWRGPELGRQFQGGARSARGSGSHESWNPERSGYRSSERNEVGSRLKLGRWWSHGCIWFRFYGVYQ
jgi:hypothetical protein